MSEDVRAVNRQAWDAMVRAGNQWTKPVTSAQVARARAGDWTVLLTPSTPVPRAWFGELGGARVLGLACGGGQQGPLFAAAGARVTIYDNSPAQLAQDRLVADRDGLELATVEGDMRDLAAFADGSFDLVFHPCSNCFVPDIAPVWREAYRVLAPGGVLLAGVVNPVAFTADLALERAGVMQMKYPIPYSDLDHPDDPEVQKLRADGNPLSFGHTLEDQLGGQLAAGFALVGLYEDGWPEAPEPVHKFLKCYLATRAIKPRAPLGGPMTERWVCIHGHFYQPPRENPWLDAIEPQPSAAPYPDWNARITAECYRPNAWARIVDGAGRITSIVDNYARMSFDVGPTLMSWLAREAKDVHDAIVAADRIGAARFDGHGPAMAQAYHHIILPLASARDRRTQVHWGVRDFERRFGRRPEGMWLPECAVDIPTLEALVDGGIAFTVLAPYQAARVRPPGGGWRDVGAADPGRVYRCPLPSGRSIDLFFYDGDLSRRVAFDRLLDDGNGLARLLATDGAGGARAQASGAPVLRHIATDGETYGHHHRYGDMALAWALTIIDRGAHAGARLTTYGEFRVRQPATWEVAIHEGTSWSCAHGVERWRSDCGCNGGHAGWNQRWRTPLRQALDWLRDRTSELIETCAIGLLRDPWAARDDYIEALFDRERTDDVLHRHAGRTLTGGERLRALELLELGRQGLLMYTSCGWFFDDLAGIETVQILRYAARACELAAHLGAPELEAGLLDRLAAAVSNRPEIGDGRALWQRHVVPARVDLPRLVAHHAILDVVGDGDDRPVEHYGHRIAPEMIARRRRGPIRLVIGRVRATVRVTGRADDLGYAVLYQGRLELRGRVGPVTDDATWTAQVDRLLAAFDRDQVEAVVAALDDDALGRRFDLTALVGRERSVVIERILDDAQAHVSGTLQRLYDDQAELVRYLVRERLPVPSLLTTAAEQVLGHRLLVELARPSPRVAEIRACLAEAAQVEIDLDNAEIAFATGAALHRAVEELEGGPEDPAMLGRLAQMAELAVAMRSKVDLWDAQNAAWRWRSAALPGWQARADAGEDDAARMVAGFERLARALRLST